MQKSFIAIALALTLVSAFAGYTATNYVAGPIQVAQDTDGNFTNPNSTLSLVSVTSGTIYLYTANYTTITGNTTAQNWKIFYRQLNTKTLAGTQNYSASIVGPVTAFFLNNYVYGFGPDNTTGFPNLWAYQIPLTSGTTGPARFQVSNNTNNSFTVDYLTYATIGNTVYVAYSAANLIGNITSFTIGATAPATTFTLSTTFDTPSSLSLTWGEALGSSQLFAVWKENGALKDAVINVSKGTVATPTVVPGYNSTIHQNSKPFVTDKTLYGELLYGFDSSNTSYTNYWLRTTANGTIVLIANYTSATSNYANLASYGPYIAVFFSDSTAASGVNYVYEIWDPSTFNTTILKKRTQYLNINTTLSTQIPFKVTSGGYYTLLYNDAQTVNGTLGTISGIQVGLLLGGSYLASVLGFLLTIVAGLLLF